MQSGELRLRNQYRLREVLTQGETREHDALTAHYLCGSPVALDPSNWVRV